MTPVPGPFAPRAGHLWPRAGWHPMTDADALELGLPIRARWELFNVEWFGGGIALAWRKAKQQ